MAPGGVGLFVLPHPDNRFGTDAFPRYLKEASFVFEQHHITDPDLTVGLAEREYFRWYLFVIWRNDGCEDTATGHEASPDDVEAEIEGEVNGRSEAKITWPSPWIAAISSAAREAAMTTGAERENAEGLEVGEAAPEHIVG